MRNTCAFLLAAFASSLHLAFAQVQIETATIPLPGGESPPEGLAGEVIGVGTDGTTIVVSNAASTDTPFTQTVVQDATHVSLVAVNPVGSGTSLSLDVQCSLSASGVGDCVIAGGAFSSGGSSFATTSVVGMLTQLEIPVSTASGVAAAATGGSSSGASGSTSPSPSPTSSASGLKIGSMLLVSSSLLSVTGAYLFL